MSWRCLSLVLVVFSPLVSIVHAGPTLPPSPAPTVWFKADAITGVGGGGAVNTWIDSSSNGNNLGAIVTAPKYVAGTPGTLNGKPYVAFGAGGLDTAMQSISNLPITGDINATVFAVLAPGTGVNGVFGWGDAFAVVPGGAAFGLFTNIYGTDGLSVEYGNANSANFGVNAFTPGAFQIVEIQKSSGAINTTTSLAVNSAALLIQPGSSSNTPSVATNPFVLGQFANLGSPYQFIGGVAEVIVYNSVLTVDQSIAVDQYLSAKYAIQLPEPASLILMLVGAALLVAAGRRRLVRSAPCSDLSISHAAFDRLI